MSVMLMLHVQPRAKRNAVEGFDENSRLRVRVTSPPADGAANDAVIGLLAETLGVARRQIEIRSGHSSRTKRVLVRGVSGADARAALSGRPDAT